MTACYTLLLFVLTLYLSGVSSQNATQAPTVTVCTNPPVIANANYTTTGLTEGSVVTYTCYAGYEGTGSHQQTCRNGIWVSSGSNMYCNVIRCSRPPSINQGSYRSQSSSSYVVGVVVTYNCYTGYTVNSSSADITCQANRTWTQPIPTCVKKDCGTPAEIEGGNRTYTTTDYSSTARYTCQEGYDLYYLNRRQYSGYYTLRCQSTGFWTGPLECKPKVCSSPPTVWHGKRYSSGSYKYGDTVTYECDYGYELHGNDTITCMKNGQWSTSPTCPKVECPSPPLVANASSSIVGRTFYGNSTVYTCHRGFEMTGSPIASCTADGAWTQQPRCTLMDCRTPPAIHYGSHRWTTTTYKSEADYSCDEGYKLIGVAKIVCQDDGHWSAAPSCELPPHQAAALPQSSAQVSSDSDSSALTGLAVACAVFGVITIFCLGVLVYKLFIANKANSLFSYASYKNGDDTVNSNL